ncbi:MAG TPA: CCA tRNA nucleotidyltransferase [Gemmatimonadales bacterium]|nr:CCA tRNA nucleotidyltransferase [Gemmatimonadales bacterium]
MHPDTDEARLLRPPGAVHRIAKRLEEAGFETWCVGGAVRDALLGIENLDWDIATAAPPAKVRSLFRRTVPVGIEFGTVSVLDERGQAYEVTTFRRDIRTDGRHAVVEFGASLDEDLARRDFTINAIAYSTSKRVLHDPFGGRSDLQSGMVRAVGDASRRMTEDRLRALRAIRFASRFGFSIHPDTWRAILESAPHLGRLSPERVKQELEKTMEQVRCPSQALRLWRDSGALATLVPPLSAVPDEVLQAIDVHALPRGSRTAGRRVLRLATLFSGLDPRDVRRVLKSLRFSNADTKWISALVALWHELGESMTAILASGPEAASDADVRRWVARAGRMQILSLLRIAAAHWSVARRQDHLASGGDRSSAGDRANASATAAAVPAAATVANIYRRATAAAFHDPVELADLAIDGEDLRRAGVQPGPGMAAILHSLLDEVLEDPARNTVDYLQGRIGSISSEAH